jgi:hypothetical protein
MYPWVARVGLLCLCFGRLKARDLLWMPWSLPCNFRTSLKRVLTLSRGERTGGIRCLGGNIGPRAELAILWESNQDSDIERVNKDPRRRIFQPVMVPRKTFQDHALNAQGCITNTSKLISISWWSSVWFLYTVWLNVLRLRRNILFPSSGWFNFFWSCCWSVCQRCSQCGNSTFPIRLSICIQKHEKNKYEIWRIIVLFALAQKRYAAVRCAHVIVRHTFCATI